MWENSCMAFFMKRKKRINKYFFVILLIVKRTNGVRQFKQTNMELVMAF